MVQTLLLHSSFLDAVSSSEHLLGSAKIHICGSKIVQRFIVTLVVAIIHKTGNLRFKLCGKIVILQVHNALHRRMIAFNLAKRQLYYCVYQFREMSIEKCMAFCP